MNANTLSKIDLTQVGIVIVATVYLLERVIAAVQKLREDKSDVKHVCSIGSKCLKHYENCDKFIEEMREAHSLKDSDGVPVWYVRSSLYTKVDDTHDIVKRIERNQDKG